MSRRARSEDTDAPPARRRDAADVPPARGRDAANAPPARRREAAAATSDPIARIVAQWAAVHPGLDAEPMAVVGRIHRLSRAVAERVEREFAAHGVSRGDYDVLASLRRAGDPPRLSPGQLCGGLMLSSAGVTGRVDRLARSGLVRRLPDPSDGRGVLVELTPKGRRLVDRLVHEDMERQAAWLQALTKAERAALVELLGKLTRAVEAGG